MTVRCCKCGHNGTGDTFTRELYAGVTLRPAEICILQNGGYLSIRCPRCGGKNLDIRPGKKKG